MKSSLMVEGDRRCTRQKGNQLKKKRVRRKRDVRNKKEIAALSTQVLLRSFKAL